MKALFIVLALALTGCSKNSANLAWELRGFRLTEDQMLSTMRVTDLDGKPVANAQILIGSGLNQPFAGNFLTADANGMFTAPSAWMTAEMVTISAPNYLRASYVGQVPAGQSFQIRRAVKEKKFELKGLTTGFKIVDKDDKIDFALVIPVLKKNDLFAFDMTKFISPQFDEITVYGQKLQMPSNVSLPKQKENYGIFPVTMEKPLYRSYFEDVGMKKIMTVRGQFPFNKVAKEMQNNKPFFELINLFSLQGGSLKEVSITGPTQTADLPVNEFIFDQQRSYKAPVVDKAHSLLVVPLSIYSGEFFPTDLKNVASNATQNLMVPKDKQALVVSILTNKMEDNKIDGKLSVAIQNFDVGVTPQLLPLIENPQVVNQNQVSVKFGPEPSFLRSFGTYSILSSVETTTVGGQKLETLNRLWEVYGGYWMDEIYLPVWPNDTAVAGKKRWEVSLVGSSAPAIDLGPVMLENASHATRSQADF